MTEQPVTPEPSEPTPTPRPPAPKTPSWIVPVLVTSLVFLVIGIVIVAVYAVLSNDNPVTNAVDPQPNLSTSRSTGPAYPEEPTPGPTMYLNTPKGYTESALTWGITWSDATAAQQRRSCRIWNSDRWEDFLDAAVRGMADLPRTSHTSHRAAVTNFMISECGS